MRKLFVLTCIAIFVVLWIASDIGIAHNRDMAAGKDYEPVFHFSGEAPLNFLFPMDRDDIYTGERYSWGSRVGSDRTYIIIGLAIAVLFIVVRVTRKLPE